LIISFSDGAPRATQAALYVDGNTVGCVIDDLISRRNSGQQSDSITALFTGDGLFEIASKELIQSFEDF
jgi:hypothetical protein